MSVKPIDFLSSAISISSSGNDEITRRNVISRAYYAAYHCACEFIKPADSDENIGVHARYIRQLNSGDNGSIERKIGGKIKSMYARRKIADYYLSDELKPDATALQLHAAKELFLTIENAKTNPSIKPVASEPAAQGAPKLRVVK